MNQIADTDLLFRLQRGDVDAFDALYWKYHQAVFANVCKLVKEPEAAKDILQEVFTALWEKRSTLDSSRPVAGWLFVVSYHKALAHLKLSLKAVVVDSQAMETAQSEDDSPFVKEQQFQLLEEAIAQLSGQKRKVFELCKLQGRTYEEAAEELNISKHTVKEYLSLATASIQAYIKAHPGGLQILCCPLLLFLSH